MSGGTLEDTNEAANKSDVYDVLCIRCGVCCSLYQPQLSLSEAQSLAEKLRLSWDDFVSRYTDLRWPSTYTFLIRHNDGACIFLSSSAGKKERLCSINPFKPSCCLKWKSGLHKKECRQGLNDIWGLMMDSSGRLCGTPEKLKEFNDYFFPLK